LLFCAVFEKFDQPVDQSAFAADYVKPTFVAMLVEDFTQISLKVRHDDTLLRELKVHFGHQGWLMAEAFLPDLHPRSNPCTDILRQQMDSRPPAARRKTRNSDSANWKNRSARRAAEVPEFNHLEADAS
jgi:hypothetical protein